VPLLLADVSPNFINLDTATGLFVHQLRAAVADFYQQPTDRVAMRAGHPLGAADRISLNQAVDDLDPADEGYTVHEPLVLMRRFDG